MIIQIFDSTSNQANYQLTKSVKGSVEYNCHELSTLSQLDDYGIPNEMRQFFDMDGNVVTPKDVVTAIDKQAKRSHRGKNERKFYSLAIMPSDDEIKALGTTVKDQFINGKEYVLNILDLYAKNFHREGIDSRHDLIAFVIPHLFKKEGKKQLHWHILQARSSKNGKSLSPLINAKAPSKNGPVHAGFNRSGFIADCEKQFDAMTGYKRPYEASYAYRLAMKKGSAEEKQSAIEKIVNLKKESLIPILKKNIQAIKSNPSILDKISNPAVKGLYARLLYLSNKNK